MVKTTDNHSVKFIGIENSVQLTEAFATIVGNNM